ncbi:hypothetical protein HPB51_004749 [Rhipicephalus microplus]|uniref:Uncharacterized protein n=1 Tax=Rhipicephalus microplus TaxID=6941 RepID=A0A9J6DTJ8_RHIMP|nr:hypothetical protein HPB51_004749 [Rhipicephalus microplus]
MDRGGNVVHAQAAEKATVASARRWLEVAMACRTVQSSLAATGEELRLSSGDGTHVAPGMVPEAKSKGACTASLDKEAVCEAKSVESPCGLARTPAGSAQASVPEVARMDVMATVAGAAGRWRVRPLRRTVFFRRSSRTEVKVHEYFASPGSHVILSVHYGDFPPSLFPEDKGLRAGWACPLLPFLPPRLEPTFHMIITPPPLPLSICPKEEAASQRLRVLRLPREPRDADNVASARLLAA